MSEFGDRVSNWLKLVRRDLLQTHKRAQRPLFALLLDPSEMPTGHWEVTSDQAFRQKKKMGAEGLRTPSAEGVSVLRYLKDGTVNRTYSVILVPFSSEENALESLPRVWQDGVFGNPFSRNKEIKSGAVDVESLSALTPMVAFESQYEGPDGPGRQRYVATVVGRMLFVANFAALRGGMWSWDDVTEVAERQVAKVREGLHRTG
jgi:hypothetical protein